MKIYSVILTIEDEKWFKIEAENREGALIEAKRQLNLPESEIVGFEIDELFND